ncbi:uncharacterized protein LOC129600884 [Paramacrobiotus metropolitanus]|uniref:uncharacterized protein LOC129600884 n=1 Tax=Paramacrobiotus metropolitanus TaxID=2943436 RepID=UPI0024456A32|nr:uncharacterized protein LOC129600884 [Paramacrobiotus metropolitanus]
MEENQRLKAELSSRDAQIRELLESQKSPTPNLSDMRSSWATVVRKKVVRGTRDSGSASSEDIVMSTLRAKRASKADKEKVKKDYCLHGIPPLDPSRHQTLDDYSKDLQSAIESNGISVRFVSIYSAKKGRKNSLFARVGSCGIFAYHEIIGIS